MECSRGALQVLTYTSHPHCGLLSGFSDGETGTQNGGLLFQATQYVEELGFEPQLGSLHKL